MCRDERKTRRFTGVVIAGAVTIGGIVALKAVASACERRRQIRFGQRRELTSVWHTVDELRMHARMSDAASNAIAPPVILVHGFGISSSYFVPTAELLATEFSVYAPDLPGHGRSETPSRPLNVPQLADALVRWLDVVDIRRASLVGNSLGCQIIVDAAARYPQMVDRLVLVGPTMDPAGRSLWKVIPRFLIGGLYERRSLTWLVLADYTRMGLRLVPELRYLLRDRIEEKLPKLQCPTMLVRGENDPLVPQRWLEQAARLVPQSRIAVIRGWGHAVNYSAPEELRRVLGRFLGNKDVKPAWDGMANHVSPSVTMNDG